MALIGCEKKRETRKVYQLRKVTFMVKANFIITQSYIWIYFHIYCPVEFKQTHSFLQPPTLFCKRRYTFQTYFFCKDLNVYLKGSILQIEKARQRYSMILQWSQWPQWPELSWFRARSLELVLDLLCRSGSPGSWSILYCLLRP